jgi:hypothetical protein
MLKAKSQVKINQTNNRARLSMFKHNMVVYAGGSSRTSKHQLRNFPESKLNRSFIFATFFSYLETVAL